MQVNVHKVWYSLLYVCLTLHYFNILWLFSQTIQAVLLKSSTSLEFYQFSLTHTTCLQCIFQDIRFHLSEKGKRRELCNCYGLSKLRKKMLRHMCLNGILMLYCRLEIWLARYKEYRWKYHDDLQHSRYVNASLFGVQMKLIFIWHIHLQM